VGSLLHISRVSGYTVLSRVLGLVRDVLLFAGLGGGAISSAFVLAFTLPNLFRRLLGEGALMSSSMPVLAATMERDGDAQTFRLLNAILSRLGAVLWLLTGAAWLLFAGVRALPDLAERWYLGAELSQWLFPYVVFICLSALTSAVLQLHHRFDIPALSQVWLNLAMIGALLAGLALGGAANPQLTVHLLCGGVLVGGVIQWWLPRWQLQTLGWRPALNFEPSPELSQLWRLLLPGLLGAAIFQLNIFISRLLAFGLDDTAAGLLYLANRMVELPLGVFAIAISTVLFPQLSRLAASGRNDEYQRVYRHGLVFIALLVLPATAGLIVLAQPILSLLFEWGLFKAEDVASAVPVLRAAVVGMPFFAWSGYLTRNFYARQNMRTPMRLAAINLLLNLVLSLALMVPLGAVGLALANAIAGACHCLLLQARLPGAERWAVFRHRDFGRIGLACIIMTACVSFALRATTTYHPLTSKPATLLATGLLIGCGLLVYGATLRLTGLRWSHISQPSS
jgi:putative peptidoglycan lipid II flippase